MLLIGVALKGGGLDWALRALGIFVVLLVTLPAGYPSTYSVSLKGAYVVPCCRREIIQAGVVPVEADLLKEGSKIRHDSRKVARCLLKMARSGL